MATSPHGTSIGFTMNLTGAKRGASGDSAKDHKPVYYIIT